MPDQVHDEETDDFLLYWGVIELSAKLAIFAPVPTYQELREIFLQHAFTTPGISELDWDLTDPPKNAESGLLFEAILSELPLEWQVISIKAFCRYEYVAETESISADVDWIVIDKDDVWFYPSGEVVEAPIRQDMSRIADFLKGLNINLNETQKKLITSKK
jgi:hypothetical protein